MYKLYLVTKILKQYGGIKMKKRIIAIISIISIFLGLTGCSNNSANNSENKPKKIILDYAYYSPVSLILKDKGFAEKAFKKDGVDVVEFVSKSR